MKIKILKPKDKLLWYYDKAGEILPVVKTVIYRKAGVDTPIYWVREGGEFNCLNIVYDTDCMVIEDDDQTVVLSGII